ncbi:lipocalin family protein [Anseongella ginsenosidimutans]|uniref:lipocalin family protein n=1 Tax=Anseongella ginsenosidimutans TaxID=496056 RepID=UPI0013152F4B|nr:lipocalin family protein [Anseongella ginsenosidimutans]
MTGCEKDAAGSGEGSLLGTWILVETKVSDGGSFAQWMAVDDAYTYTFKKDGSFASSKFSDCVTGTYTITGDQLILTYSCERLSGGIQSPQGGFVENFLLIGEFLILTPQYTVCYEGCGNKFLRVRR